MEPDAGGWGLALYVLGWGVLDGLVMITVGEPPWRGGAGRGGDVTSAAKAC